MTSTGWALVVVASLGIPACDSEHGVGGAVPVHWYAAAIAVADIDGDGAADIASADPGVVRLFRRVENGTYDVDSAGLDGQPPALSPHQLLAWEDVDLDGDLDLTAGDGWGVWIARNDAGKLGDGAELSGERVEALAWGDVDGDGAPDLLTSSPHLSRVYRNDGVGGLHVWAEMDSPTAFSDTGVAWADFDGDGDDDIVFARDYGGLLRNDGGTLMEVELWGFLSSKTLLAYDATPASAGDELLLDDGAECELWFEEPDQLRVGVDCRAPRLPDGLGLVHRAAYADYDGDGDLDMFADIDSTPTVLRGDGGAYVLVWSDEELGQQVGTRHPSNDLAWGDVDGDGDLDLVAAYHARAIRVYRNDGDTFVLETCLASTSSPHPDIFEGCPASSAGSL